MKILVTGANGYIGERFVRLARRAGHTVISATRRPPLDKTDWVQFDFERSEINLPVEVDAVLHLATTNSNEMSSAGVNESEVRSTRALINSLFPSTRFIFVSSQTSYADAPTSYGRTKWLIEQDVLKNDGVVIRPGQVYGGRPRALFATLVETIEKLPLLPAFVPAPKIQPIHVDDCATALLRVVELQERNRIYCLGAEQPVSFNRFMKLMATEFCRRNRLFVPVPKFILRALSRVVGERRANRLGFSRLESLFRLPEMETSQDLKSISLKLRDLESGMHRSGDNRRRRLLREANAMLTYILNARPTGVLTRRYVRMIEKLDRGPALTIPSTFLRWPAFFSSLEGHANDDFQREFNWRLNAATLIAEASPMGASTFLGLEEKAGALSAISGILISVCAEAFWRIVRVVSAPFLFRSFSRGIHHDS